MGNLINQFLLNAKQQYGSNLVQCAIPFRLRLNEVAPPLFIVYNDGMKLFCAYAFTGEDADAVTKRMRLVVDTLNDSGHTAYCNRFDKIVNKLQEKDDIKGILQEAFKNVGKNEALVAIIASPSRSIGQIMEIGIAMSQQKPVFLLEHSSAVGSSYLPRLVDKYFRWESADELKLALKQL